MRKGRLWREGWQQSQAWKECVSWLRKGKGTLMGLQQPGFSGGWMKMRDTIPFFSIIYDYERTLFFSPWFLVIKDLFAL